MPISRDGKYALDDVFLKGRLAQIIKERGIKEVVETGLNEGNSTVEFCRIAPHVTGIDIDPICTESALSKLEVAGLGNCIIITGDSRDVLAEIVPMLPDETLFFLDAHWGEPWPLPGEIRALKKGKGVIVVHDIKVPGTDLGFDGVMFEGQVHDFTYELIKPFLDKWSPTHTIEYMKVGSGSYRGAAIFYP